MVRHFRSVRRNNRKRLTRRMRGGSQPPTSPPPPQPSPSVGNMLSRGKSLFANSGFGQALSTITEKASTVKDNLLTGISSAQGSLEEGAKEAVVTALLQIREKYPEQYNGVALFNSVDTNNDGSIDKDEFNKLMKKVGLTNDITNKLLFDYIASAKIGPKEFLEYYPRIEKFNQIDADHDGSISKKEFDDAFPGQPDEFTQCKKDSDGSLNIAEFIKCMYPKRSASAQGGRSSSRKYKYTNKLRNSRRSRSY